MKVSALTAEIAIKYTRANADDVEFMGAVLEYAKSYCMNYTGLTIDEMDKHIEMAIAVLALCAEMYEMRQYTVEAGQVLNTTTANILAMHSKNYL